MNRDQKAAVVDEIAGEIADAGAIFAVDYRGLSVSQAAELRTRLRDANTKFRIVKNSLSERAAEKAGTDQLKALLEGPTALALVHGDAALAAKALNDAARAFNILEFKGGMMDGTALSAEDVRSIARLPAREVLHAQLVGSIASPISGVVRGLNALIAGIAMQLKAIADQGLVSGEAPGTSGVPATGEESAASEEPAASGDAAPEEPASATEDQAAAESSPGEEPAPEAVEKPVAEPAGEETEQTEAQDASDAESSDA
jgi:large subunit ribosomal protein L10